jgi:hypothetical protein
MFLEDHMKNQVLLGTALLLMLGAPLAAQEVRYGLAFNLAAPTGAFNNTTYSANAANPAPTQFSYNSGAGFDFLVMVPVNRMFAMRYSAGYEAFTGSATSSGYYALNLSDEMFTVGATAQLFLGDGNANRQSGTYLLGGVCLDLERFANSYGDPTYDPSNSTNQTRFGAQVGIGHTFRSRWGGRYLMEASYHKTLTSDNTNAGDPPPADYLKFNFGWIF